MAHTLAQTSALKPARTARGHALQRSVHVFGAANPEISRSAASSILRKFAERSGLAPGILRAQLIPDATWKRAKSTLGPNAAQTIARLAHALEFATRTWQSESDAIDWLLGPHIELGGATPFSMLRTESGGRAVESVMAALEYGFPL